MAKVKKECGAYICRMREFGEERAHDRLHVVLVLSGNGSDIDGTQETTKERHFGRLLRGEGGKGR